MKVRCLLPLLLPALAASAETYNIDAGRSQIAFTIHQFVSTVRGDFHRFNGTIEVDREHPERSSVIVRISVGSIDTRIKKRDQHLLSSEFFDAGKFPEIIFKELLPNLLPYLVASLVTAVSGAILASIGLEVLGLGSLDSPISTGTRWFSINRRICSVR